ncbi:MAG: rRNA maturation RNase YbeY [Bacilli bacterium]|nr:rRNA maturation RNase YbeY [Bacilli bacterium]
MKIKVFNQYGRLPFPYRAIVKTLTEDVATHFNENREASLIFVSNDEIRKMNRDYRKIDKVTDVISFEEEEEDYLGEIFISVDRLLEQAKDFNHSPIRECAFLLIHGILHLMGYDHMNPEDEAIMFHLQEEILNRCGYRRENNG